METFGNKSFVSQTQVCYALIAHLTCDRAASQTSGPASGAFRHLWWTAHSYIPLLCLSSGHILRKKKQNHLLNYFILLKEVVFCLEKLSIQWSILFSWKITLQCRKTTVGESSGSSLKAAVQLWEAKRSQKVACLLAAQWWRTAPGKGDTAAESLPSAGSRLVCETQAACLVCSNDGHWVLITMKWPHVQPHSALGLTQLLERSSPPAFLSVRVLAYLLMHFSVDKERPRLCADLSRAADISTPISLVRKGTFKRGPNWFC